MNGFDIHFTLDELNMVLRGLGKMPFEESAPLIKAIQDQAGEQYPVNKDSEDEETDTDTEDGG